jgi:hypothetical protein
MNHLFDQSRFRLLIFLLLLFSCKKTDEKITSDAYNENKPSLEETDRVPQTIFNEENHSTDYGDIQVFIGETIQKEGVYYVDVKVETRRENYQIEIVGNLSDGKGNIRGARIDSFSGPASFEHHYEFEELEGFRPYLVLVSIYNPIDGNWNDLKFKYFEK